ncbi:hypothetical protein EYF80_064966 [Liparis tanakae]|uniref:Uncharacterized protein n=1 Tax=Liparis tanakae TaxID=230148 RepID=A0A4Z2E7W4_9TELE|nr:hypothetical protein EYF80_064966 [Liparis tanakae]
MERCLCLEAVPTTCCLITELLTATSCWFSTFSPNHWFASVWKPFLSTGSGCRVPGTACLNTCCTA